MEISNGKSHLLSISIVIGCMSLCWLMIAAADM